MKNPEETIWSAPAKFQPVVDALLKYSFSEIGEPLDGFELVYEEATKLNNGQEFDRVILEQTLDLDFEEFSELDSDLLDEFGNWLLP